MHYEYIEKQTLYIKPFYSRAVRIFFPQHLPNFCLYFFTIFCTDLDRSYEVPIVPRVSFLNRLFSIRNLVYEGG